MAITRKPKVIKKEETAPVDVDALINRGGSVAGRPVPSEKEKIVTVNLRVPSETLNRVDQAVQSRPFKIPRHTWLMEAIVEKLKREQK